jgi:ribosome-interacting GTPase 1
MQADIKRRLSQARKESQKKGATHALPFYFVTREGAGQVALVGPANSGKSSLVRVLTHALPEVAEYPFTTRLPMPGMMAFENVQIQLVDLPPISADFTEPWLPQAIRNANASVLVVDVNDAGSLEEMELVETNLRNWRLPLPHIGCRLPRPLSAHLAGSSAMLCCERTLRDCRTACAFGDSQVSEL